MFFHESMCAFVCVSVCAVWLLECVHVYVHSQAGEGVTVRALNFKQLQTFLSCTGERKLSEVRLCLEGMQTACMYVCMYECVYMVSSIVTCVVFNPRRACAARVI